MSDKQTRKVRVRLVRSVNGRLKSHRACVRGLGLRRINQTRELDNTPQIRGMVRKVSYMVECEEIN